MSFEHKPLNQPKTADLLCHLCTSWKIENEDAAEILSLRLIDKIALLVGGVRGLRGCLPGSERSGRRRIHERAGGNVLRVDFRHSSAS